VEISLAVAANTEHRDVAKVLTIRDITQRRNLQAQLSQAQKLEGIGQLAAGIAHEINTPTQYIGDNLRFLNDSLQPIAAAMDEMFQAMTPGDVDVTDSLARAAERLRAIDWNFLRTEIPRAFADSLDGVERVARIVTSMKEFSHPDSNEKQTVDVNRVVTSAVNVCRHEWRQVAEVALDLDPALPGVPGFAGDLGQVVLNLVVNAAHAIGERGELGHIEVKTRASEDGVVVTVMDDGPGIPDHVKPRIFEQFFTTKPVGKGTGQGLSLVHRIVVNRHGGKVWFESCVGKGTTFSLLLPL
jgi:signal transduction histidine kinase